jgi:hypothetical protein
MVTVWVLGYQKGMNSRNIHMLRKRNIVVLIQGKPLPWRWLLLLRSGKWRRPRGSPWGEVSIEKA